MVLESTVHITALLLLLAAAAVHSASAERLGDFNGDGKADVLLRHDDGSWRMHIMDGASAGPGLPVHITPKLEFYWAGAGDFNGDGRDDVLLRRDDGVWLYYALDGSRVIPEASGWANLTRNLDFRVVGVADFNDDDRDDVLMRRNDGVWLYSAMNGRRVIKMESGWSNLARDPDWRMSGIGDFDGDGRADVLIRHVHGTWRYYSMYGRRAVAGTSPTMLLPIDRQWQIAGIGDFGSDGRDSVLLRHADGRWQYQAVDSAANVPADLDRDWRWRLAGIGDIDGDGGDDVLLRHDDGRWQWGRTAGRHSPNGVGFTPADNNHWRIPNRPVHIPDTGLRQAVVDAVGKVPGESIRPRELVALTELRAGRAGITDLTGLGAATGLSALNLGDNKIMSVAPLAGLVRLSTLYLHHNDEIGDISVLAHLPTLRQLGLGSNKVVDVSPLVALTQLSSLGLGYNAIEDVSPLASLTTLEYLSLDANRIVDVSPLAELSGLTRLRLIYNQIEDISPLGELTELRELRLAGNGLQDITPLANLTRLGILGLQRNRIADVKPLQNLTGLYWLWLRGNRIEDISPLAGLTHLTQLLLQDNRVKDIATLASMPLLEELNLERNEVVDISAVRSLTRLVELRLSSNRLSDLSPLAGLSALTRLSLASNDLHDIGSLSELKALRELVLAYNHIEDISPLAGLTHLNVLRLERNRVVDIAALEHLTNLDTLNLAFNRIADLSPLVNNPGLNDGDLVDVRGNPLSEESTATVVPTLVSRGVRVEAGTPARFELVHDDNVVVLHVEADLAKQDLYSGLPLDLYSTILYAHFEDVFDFVMFFSNLDDIDEHQRPHYYGVYSSVRTTPRVSGCGRSTTAGTVPRTSSKASCTSPTTGHCGSALRCTRCCTPGPTSPYLRPSAATGASAALRDNSAGSSSATSSS